LDKKQLVWILLLAAAVAFLLPRLLHPTPPPSATPPTSAPAPLSQRWNYGGALLSQMDLEKDQVSRPLLGSLRPEDGYKLQVQIDPRGAAIYTVKLMGYYRTVEQKRVKNKTDQQLQDWSYPLLNPVAGGDEEFLPYSTERLRVEREGKSPEEISTFQGPLTVVHTAGAGAATSTGGRIVWYQVGEKETTPDGTQSVKFALELYPSQDAKEPSYRLTKTYSLKKGDNSLRMSLKVENLSGQGQRLSVLQNGPAGLPRDDISQDFRSVLSGRYVAAEGKITVPHVITREDVRNNFSKAQAGKGGWPIGYRESMGDNSDKAQPVVWAGQINRFFGSMMYPLPHDENPSAIDANTPVSSLVLPQSQYPYAFNAQVVREDANSVVPAVVFDGKGVDVADQGALELDYDIYCGPKDRDLLSRVPLYQKLNYTGTIQFYSCKYCLVSQLALGVIWILETGGRWIHNYGVVIIVLVLVVRVLLHPITKRSQVSMMRMQKLGPKMKEVQEKYKDDKAAQQKAMGEVFRQTGVSPILGCLPMVLQTPIWAALYAGLQSSVALRQQGLLPFWITDLSAPDTIIHWTPITLPLIGNIAGLNLLPILLMIFMFLQQKLTPMQSAPTTTPDQQRQQKLMMYMMSGMMLFIFYNMPSGLTLYIMTSTAAGVIESQVIRKHIREREAAEAAAETKVAVPGWIPRGKRPKKPKGPFGA
jgi:YidC/Oxa1 family membrane protein insertase